ncbi:DUF2127 domain-containing protein [Pengzhenrongella phosphoraccumulans]|jgi:uncharacterized membrane protein|uniref:DUF2127 domain-containing protein n=1 Tax=Pengzhenrongella phosphoraccumulans TaxID=3114394 RepID=UPI00388DA89F
MSWFRPASVLDKVFEGGLLLKGVSGALELLAGLLLFFISPASLAGLLSFITQREIAEDPHDRIATFILHSADHFSSGNKAFAIAYLWVHAAIKLIAVIGILRNKLWAYPFSLITLGLLMLFQIYSIVVRFSLGMVALTLFDAVILWLIWREYAKVRPAPATTRSAGLPH